MQDLISIYYRDEINSTLMSLNYRDTSVMKYCKIHVDVSLLRNKYHCHQLTVVITYLDIYVLLQTIRVIIVIREAARYPTAVK